MVDLVEFNREFLKLSYYWLKDVELKKLTNTPDFTEEQQECWFKKLKERRNYFVWGLIFKNIKIGACGLKNFSNNRCEYWGYIGDKCYWGIGLGSVILNQIVLKAQELNVHTIYLSVNTDNIRAIRLYEKFGFLKKYQKKNLIFMEYDLIEI